MTPRIRDHNNVLDVDDIYGEDRFEKELAWIQINMVKYRPKQKKKTILILKLTFSKTERNFHDLNLKWTQTTKFMHYSLINLR